MVSLPYPLSPARLGVVGLCGTMIAIAAALGHAKDRPVSTIALLVIASGFFFVACVRSQPTISVRWILGIAVCLRLIVLPAPPTLSDDLLRYVWDGRVIAAGFNPYLLAPEAAELATLRDASWAVMPHHHVPTVYPPLALSLFAVAAAFPKPLLGIKILLVLADLATCLFLIRLAANLGLPRQRCLWYCWNPLVIVETAGMGHVDALMGTFTLMALVLLTGRSPRLLAAAAAAGSAVLAKLMIVVALPCWILHLRSFRFFAMLTVIALIIIATMAATLGGLPPGLVTYAVSWEFNGPLFEPCWRLLAAADATNSIKSILDQIKTLTGHHQIWNEMYPYVYPQFISKLLLAGAFGAMLVFVCARSWRAHQRPEDWDGRLLVADTGRVLGVFLVCSATLYPWYLLWILPLAALARHWSWLLLSATVQLSYLPQLLEVDHFPWFFAAVWLPPLLVWRKSHWSFD